MKNNIFKFVFSVIICIFILNFFILFASAQTTVTSNSVVKGYFIVQKEVIDRYNVLLPVFSHNGKYLAYIKKDRKKGLYNLFVKFLESKETVQVTKGIINWDDVWKMVMLSNPWSYDDEYLVFPAKNKYFTQKFGDKESAIQLGIARYDGKEKIIVSPKNSSCYYPSWFHKSKKLVYLKSQKNIKETKHAKICLYDMTSKSTKILLDIDCNDYQPTGLYPSFDDEKLAVWYIEKGSKKSILKIYKIDGMKEIGRVEGEGRKMARLPVEWTKDSSKLVFSYFAKKGTDAYLSIYDINTKKLRNTKISVIYPFPISDTMFFAHAPLYDLNNLKISVSLVSLNLSQGLRIPIGKNIMGVSYDLNLISEGIVRIAFWDRYKKPNEICIADLEEREVSEELLNKIKSNEEKDKVARELFKSKVFMYEIISALEEYFDKKQKYPKSLNSLIDEDLLKEIPKDSLGRNIIYESMGKKYYLSTHPHLGWRIKYSSKKDKFEVKPITTP